MNPNVLAPWSLDWLWSLPLILFTVVVHSFGLGFLNQRVILFLSKNGNHRLREHTSIIIIGGSALGATVLHGFEAAIWAASYQLLGAIPDQKSAMLYSLNAMTAFGHADIFLHQRWELMGSLEALNGWILFGLTAAFIFTVSQKVWPHMSPSA